MKKIEGKFVRLTHGATQHVGPVAYVSVVVRDFNQEGNSNNPYISVEFFDWQGEVINRAPLLASQVNELISALEKAKAEVKKRPNKFA